MSDRLHYFAYGSNMSIERLKSRVQSALFVCRAELIGHVLKFHKPSKNDGSGKCDAARSSNSQDRVHGAVFSILEDDLSVLDKYEGQGSGYDRKTVSLIVEGIKDLEAQTYFATKFDSALRPLDWYKEHVVRGARAIGLPPSYIELLESIPCDFDTNEKRRSAELAMYD